MKLKKLKEKVMWYADILGVSHLVGKIKVNKEIEAEANTFLKHYLDECDLTFRTATDRNVIHELLHLAFKNTAMFPGKLTNVEFYDVFIMIHEQEIDRMALALAKQFPYEEQTRGDVMEGYKSCKKESIEEYLKQ